MTQDPLQDHNTLLLPAAFSSLVLGCGASTPPVGRERPNILLVVSDDQDYEHLGFLGNEVVHTPTIDALAAEGTVFPVLHMTPRCRPSLAVLLSGRYPHEPGNGIYYNRGPRTLAPGGRLPERLRDAGYATFCGGKFWEGDPLAMGFDVAPAGAEEFVREGQDELFRWLEALPREQPFFVWWAPSIPHLPHDPPEEHLARIDPDAIELPEWFTGDPDLLRTFEHDSMAMGAWFDHELGRLLEVLERLGERDDTLVCFLIDNGYSNGLISKGSSFEKGVRTPLVLSWPGRIPAQRIDALVASVDVTATLLDYAGIEAPPGELSGRSLRPAIEGRPFEERDLLFGAAYGRTASDPADPAADAFSLYARDATTKYVLYLQDVPAGMWEITRAAPLGRHDRKRGEENLYDLARDPYEKEDLAADPAQRARKGELREAALAWWKATGGGPLPLP